MNVVTINSISSPYYSVAAAPLAATPTWAAPAPSVDPYAMSALFQAMTALNQLQSGWGGFAAPNFQAPVAPQQYSQPVQAPVAAPQVAAPKDEKYGKSEGGLLGGLLGGILGGDGKDDGRSLGGLIGTAGEAIGSLLGGDIGGALHGGANLITDTVGFGLDLCLKLCSAIFPGLYKGDKDYGKKKEPEVNVNIDPAPQANYNYGAPTQNYQSAYQAYQNHQNYQAVNQTYQNYQAFQAQQASSYAYAQAAVQVQYGYGSPYYQAPVVGQSYAVPTNGGSWAKAVNLAGHAHFEGDGHQH